MVEKMGETGSHVNIAKNQNLIERELEAMIGKFPEKDEELTYSKRQENQRGFQKSRLAKNKETKSIMGNEVLMYDEREELAPKEWVDHVQQNEE